LVSKEGIRLEAEQLFSSSCAAAIPPAPLTIEGRTLSEVICPDWPKESTGFERSRQIAATRHRAFSEDVSAIVQLFHVDGIVFREVGKVSHVCNQTISGSKEKRPELDRLMADAHRRRFDAVVVWKFDRFARSVSHLLRALETFPGAWYRVREPF
jgi:hypothetical protein